MFSSHDARRVAKDCTDEASSLRDQSLAAALNSAARAALNLAEALRYVEELRDTFPSKPE